MPQPKAYQVPDPIGVKGKDGVNRADPANWFPIGAQQVADAGNSATITSTSPTGASPGTPFVGTQYASQTNGIQETLTILTAVDGLGNPIPDLGFTFTFRGLPEGVVVQKTITPFNTRRVLHTTDWLSNAWTNYQVEVAPSRTLLAGETIYVSTRHSRLAGNKFLFPTDYDFRLSEQVAPFVQAIQKGIGFDGTSGQVALAQNTVDDANSLGIAGHGANGSITALDSVDFTTDTFTKTAHGLVAGDAVVLSTTGVLPSGLTSSTTNADGEVSETPYWVRDVTANTFKLSASITGSSPGAAVNFTDNGTGIHSFQKRFQFVGAIKDIRQVGHLFPYILATSKPVVARAEWFQNLTGTVTDSIIVSSAIPLQTFENALGPGLNFYVGVSVLQDNTDEYYRLRYVAGPSFNLYFEIRSLIGRQSYTGSFAALNSALSNISLALLTRAVQAGYDANGEFRNARIGSEHAAGSTTAPLPGNTGSGTAHKWRGEWLRWQGNYAGLVLTVAADVGGEFFLQFSQAAAPTEGVAGDPIADGGDGSVVDATDHVTYDPSTRALHPRHYSVQSEWVRAAYDNGPAAQSTFTLDVAYLTSAAVEPLTPLNAIPTAKNLGTMAQEIQVIEKNEATALQTDRFEKRRGTLNTRTNRRGAHTHLTGQDYENPIRPVSKRRTGQIVLNTATPSLIPIPTDIVPKSLEVTNLSSTTRFYIGGAGLTQGTGHGIPPGVPHAEEFGAEFADQVANMDPTYLLADGSPPASDVQNRFGTGQANSVAVTNPANIVADDANSAIFTGPTSYDEVTGFTAQGTYVTKQQVRIGVKCAKDTNQTTEQVAVLTPLTTAAAGNVGQITISSIPLTAGALYLLFISPRNPATAITSITNTMGFSGATLIDVKQNTGGTALHVYRMTGTPGASGNIVVNMSPTATNVEAAVMRVSGFDTGVIIENHEVLPAGNTSAASYSDSIVGTARGLAVVATNQQDQTSTPGSGFTEQLDVRTGTGVNDSSLAINTLALPGTGAQAYSGTFSGTEFYSLVAFTIKPAPAIDPVLRIPYKVSSTVGATAFQQAISSTTEQTYYQALPDRTWTAADIAAVTLMPQTPTIGAAQLKINTVFLEVTEVSTTDVPLASYEWVGDPIS